MDPTRTVHAVVVTRHRPELLADGLAVIAGQTRRPDHLVVVDNGPDEKTREVVESCGLPVTYLPSQHNLGGAGGYALGMLTALAAGADWLWMADDDGRPADEHVLATLLEVAERRGLAEVSPVIADAADPERLAFPLRRGLTWVRRRRDLDGFGDGELMPGIAHLFNGALFRAATLDVVGVPDLRLFVRGDEVELHRRLMRSGLPYGTCLTTAYVHPDGSDEFKPMLGGRLHAQDPGDATKRYYTYRNRGYLLAQPGLRRLGAIEHLRFGWYFLVERRDPRALREWLRLVRLGRREQFRRA
ncbi:glycosyltransferase [Actinomycetospora chiangmaiensis]|uniref:galactofuranosyltransferase GlfT1 n=1 Tax=Actinomycetospora chiangmaiensis TaxID=402650 RepID=UPI00036423DA|nr:glycosyltransferase family 2 protein [Actinomycetospora chiangmaiensis]